MQPDENSIKMPDMAPRHRVVVVGGGPVGGSCALGLAHAGVAVTLITSAPPPTGTGAQARSAALFPPSLALLERLGTWEASDAPAASTLARTSAPPLVASSAPLRAIRLIDDMAGWLRAPEVVFEASEVGCPSFGYNVPNGALATALRGRLTDFATSGALTWIEGRSVVSVEPDTGGVDVVLDNGTRIVASLVVAADGRHSVCRTGADIACVDKRYDQIAVTTTFTHQRPHDGISTEFHRPAGPCTTVPLPGNASSLVWVERPTIAERMLTMDDAAFIGTLEKQLRGLLGTVRSVMPRGRFPLTWMKAETFANRRVMLVGEAAHVMPPIGAQGLNLGLRDVGCLIDCVVDAIKEARDPGGQQALDAYNKARAGDIGARMTAVDALNRSLLSDLVPVRLARGLGLHVVASLGPLRRRLIQEGLQPSGPLPSLMQPT